MIKIENADVYGFQHAIRGMRNAFRSWDKSDSQFLKSGYLVGDADMSLMKRLAKAGSDEAKYRRMIVVYADITAPLYWWKEYDTYKVGTVGLSESTMHSIADKEFRSNDFSHEHLKTISRELFEQVKTQLNNLRETFLKYDDLDVIRKDLLRQNGITSKKDIWWQMIQLLPSSYNQHRTVMLNYEVLANMYHARRNHKLDEWHEFCKWARELPYSEIFTGEGQS